MSDGIVVNGDVILHGGVGVARIKPGLTPTYKDIFVDYIEAERLEDGELSEASKKQLLKEFEKGYKVGLLRLEQFKQILEDWMF